MLHAPTPTYLSSKALVGADLGIALAATYAISSLSQGKLCSTIYGPTRTLDDSIVVYTRSDTLPPDLDLHNWSWCDIDTDALLFLPLESRILDHQRLTTTRTKTGPPCSTRHGGRTSRCDSLPKCPTSAGISPGVLEHYECLLHERN